MALMSQPQRWHTPDAYEAYMGRWSRRLAGAFVRWLNPAPGLTWLDVGCGTGALSQAVLDAADPHEILGVDPGESFLNAARAAIRDPRATFAQGDACSLPVRIGSRDVVVAGLVLDFVSEPAAAIAEMVRATRDGGLVAAYVWDVSDGMQMLRAFWDAVATVEPDTAARQATQPSSTWRPGSLAKLFGRAGLSEVTVDAIAVPTWFRDFDDFWQPFLLPGSSPAQRYLANLDHAQRLALQEQVRRMLPIGGDGSIDLTARAWAVTGVTGATRQKGG